jgi:hypothetical protein
LAEPAVARIERLSGASRTNAAVKQMASARQILRDVAAYRRLVADLVGRIGEAVIRRHR